MDDPDGQGPLVLDPLASSDVPLAGRWTLEQDGGGS
jgi:hypothetical protein